jgi:hypothetical protein
VVAAQAATSGLARANRLTRVLAPAAPLAPGRYVVGVRMAAWANPDRTSVLVGRSFRVVAGSHRT